MSEQRWTVTETTGGEFLMGYKVKDQNGHLIAECHDHGNALLVAQLPQLKELRFNWATIINRLAHIVRSGVESSNDNDYAEDMIIMVRPFLGCAFIDMSEVDEFVRNNDPNLL